MAVGIESLRPPRVRARFCITCMPCTPGTSPTIPPSRPLSILILIAAGFVGGYGYGRWYRKPQAAKSARKILYYVDAMHPWYKSDKPGIAPDCGMNLVPVYE